MNTSQRFIYSHTERMNDFFQPNLEIYSKTMNDHLNRCIYAAANCLN